jgi:hypothetical protein
MDEFRFASRTAERHHFRKPGTLAWVETTINHDAYSCLAVVIKADPAATTATLVVLGRGQFGYLKLHDCRFELARGIGTTLNIQRRRLRPVFRDQLEGSTHIEELALHWNGYRMHRRAYLRDQILSRYGRRRFPNMTGLSAPELQGNEHSYSRANLRARYYGYPLTVERWKGLTATVKHYNSPGEMSRIAQLYRAYRAQGDTLTDEQQLQMGALSSVLENDWNVRKPEHRRATRGYDCRGPRTRPARWFFGAGWTLTDLRLSTHPIVISPDQRAVIGEETVEVFTGHNRSVFIPASLVPHTNLFEDDEGNYTTFQEEAIGGYHSSKSSQHQLLAPGGAVPVKPEFEQETMVGIELEMEVIRGSRAELAREVRAAARTAYKEITGKSDPACVAIERDSSLSDGFELVTSYGPMATMRPLLAKTFGLNAAGKLPWASSLRSHGTTTCGLHVHLDMPESLIHLARLIEFYNAPGNRRLITAIARRYNTGYALIGNAPQFLAAIKQTKQHNYNAPIGTLKDRVRRAMCSSRYSAVNTEGGKTVEIRVFRGTLNPVTLVACVEFAYAVWHFARTMRTMDTENFLTFIDQPEWRAQTGALRATLASKGIRVYQPKPVRGVVVPALVTADDVEPPPARDEDDDDDDDNDRDDDYDDYDRDDD